MPHFLGNGIPFRDYILNTSFQLPISILIPQNSKGSQLDEYPSPSNNLCDLNSLIVVCALVLQLESTESAQELTGHNKARHTLRPADCMRCNVFEPFAFNFKGVPYRWPRSSSINDQQHATMTSQGLPRTKNKQVKTVIKPC